MFIDQVLVTCYYYTKNMNFVLKFSKIIKKLQFCQRNGGFPVCFFIRIWINKIFTISFSRILQIHTKWNWNFWKIPVLNMNKLLYIYMFEKVKLPWLGLDAPLSLQLVNFLFLGNAFSWIYSILKRKKGR